MSGSSPTTIHIGFTKAASTLVQSYLGWHPDIYYPDRSDVWKLYTSQIELLFDKDAAKNYLARVQCDAGETKLVLSHERLSGNPHSGYYDIDQIAYRLHRTVTRPKIVIVIREQYDLIASIYKQYVRVGGVKSLAEYASPPDDGRVPLFTWKPLLYVGILNLYHSLFGKENVCILLFEELKNDREIFLHKLCDFIGVENKAAPDHVVSPKNVGVSEALLDKTRAENLFYPHFNSFRDFRGFGSLENVDDDAAKTIPKLANLTPNAFLETHDVKTEVQRLIPGVFGNSNGELGELLGCDLGALGYGVG